MIQYPFLFQSSSFLQAPKNATSSIRIPVSPKRQKLLLKLIFSEIKPQFFQKHCSDYIHQSVNQQFFVEVSSNKTSTIVHDAFESS